MGRWSWLMGIVVAVALTVASGVIQGRMSDRWGPPAAVYTAAETIDQLPKTVKGQSRTWELLDSEELTEIEKNTLKPINYFCRRYICRAGESQLGAVVRVTLLVGLHGPISVHNPEICYSARDFPVVEAKRQVPIGESGDTFWAETVSSNDADRGKLRIYWGWSTGKTWTAPDDARFHFAGSPYLYKLQLASREPGGIEVSAGDACKEFLEDFVPLLQGYLLDSEANGR